MAKLELSRNLSITPEHAWEHVSDFSALGDWLKLHQGWRGELPAELEVGTTLVGVAGVKGMRNRVTWTVRQRCWRSPATASAAPNTGCG